MRMRKKSAFLATSFDISVLAFSKHLSFKRPSGRK